MDHTGTLNTPRGSLEPLPLVTRPASLQVVLMIHSGSRGLGHQVCMCVCVYVYVCVCVSVDVCVYAAGPTARRRAYDYGAAEATQSLELHRLPRTISWSHLCLSAVQVPWSSPLLVMCIVT